MVDVRDVVVIGAGAAGIYMLHKLRGLGFDAVVLEAGEGVGGTWYWNRYPGARCDIQSIEYSFSFDESIQQDWDWSEMMAPQGEIERYLNFVVDRLELRDGIRLGTRVESMRFDEDTATWTVTTATGEEHASRYVVAATGMLSVPLEPAIDGRESFQGASLYTSRFPEEGFDFTQLRVAVIGTGSSGVQAVPQIAEQAAQLYVFQRSAAYTRPSPNRRLTPEERAELKARYADIRRRERESFFGTIFFQILPLPGAPPITRKILETPMEERLRVLDEQGWTAPWSWVDIVDDMEANAAARELYGILVRRKVHDPDTAESLIPHYPLGCKRLIVDDGYYEAFNRDNVTLVDLRKGGIKEIEAGGIATEQGFYELDAIVYATGFDAMTGALTRIDVRGRGDRLLKDAWEDDGPITYLGFQAEGFPNLFMIGGPGSPGPRSNVMGLIEYQVGWIADTLDHLRTEGMRAIEPEPGAAARWADHAASLLEGTVLVEPSCDSWYLGANVPGKRRIYMPYIGGLRGYREKCDSAAAQGYQGFSSW